MEGITFNRVREILDELKNQIPATDEVAEYTLSSGISEKDGETRPFFILIAKCGEVRIDMHVQGAQLITE